MLLSTLLVFVCSDWWARVGATSTYDLVPLSPNSAKNGIWYRWQPILEISDGSDCVSFPAIDINGVVAGAYVEFDKANGIVYSCPNSRGQTYSRLWITNNRKEQGIVYTWFFPRSNYEVKIWLSTVYWMSTKNEALLGCSFYGIFDDEILPNGSHHGWKHYKPAECQQYQVYDEWGTLRNVISKWHNYLQPGGGGKRSLRGLPDVLNYEFMPERLKFILGNSEFGNNYAKFQLGSHGWYGMPALYELFQKFLMGYHV